MALVLALALSAMSAAFAQADWYVTTSGSDSNNGQTWGTAFATIEKAVNSAVQFGGYEIWIAKGTYVVSASVSIPWTGAKIPLKLYAGFAGDESSLTQRDWVANATVIDGNNAVESVISVNQWVDLIDGFTITGGTAGGWGTGGAIDIRGCGNISPQPVLRNLVIRSNGGDTSHPPAYYEGGGIYIEDCSPWIINTSFSNNRVWAHGGAIFARDTDGSPVDTYPKVVNSTFTGNHSDVNGGAVGVYGGTITIANSILWGDTAGDGVTQELFGITLSVGSSDIDPSQPGWAGVNGNIQVDPKLAGIGRYHLREASPCIDSGNDALWTTFVDGFESDFDGDNRFLDGGSGTASIDMGADEYVPGATRLLHVDGALGNDSNSGLDWASAMATLQAAVAAAAGFDAEIWVKQGTYTLTSSIVLTPVNANLGVYGGFAGTEVLRDQRSADASLTVLDGQDAHSCFSLDWTSLPGATGNIVIDGFTLDRGNHAVTVNSVDGTLIHNCRLTNATVDGAVYTSNSDLTVSSSYFSGNSAVHRAGAIHMNAASDRLTVTDSVFSGNSAIIDGGSLSGSGGAIKASTGTVERSIFLGNMADRHGGAIYDYGLGEGLLVRNSLFSGNLAGLDYFLGTGGGTYGPVKIVNSTLSGNSAVVGAGGASGATSIINSILWDNLGVAPVENFNYNCVAGRALYSDIGDASYSNVTTCQTPYGNINADPLFADADGADNLVGTADDDLTLLASSPAIDAGDSLALAFGAVDLAGNSRHNDDPAVVDSGSGPPPMIDMGAYERQASAPAADYDLTMQVVGNGTTAPLAGVHNYPAGSIVTVGASAAPGWLFTGWTGWVDDPLTSPTSVTMNWDRTVTANFVEAYTLAVDVLGNGTGTVTSSPAGISCPPDCSEIYPVGTDVTLSSAVDPGTVFDGWVGGGCIGTTDCDLSMAADVSVAALCDLEGACGLGDAMTLQNLTIDWTHVFESCSSIAAAAGFTVESPGDVLFRAGTSSTMGNGFSIGTGSTFEVQLYPDVGLDPGISVSKTADPTTASSGDPVAYTIQVENTGEVPLTEVSVVDAKCSASPLYQSGDDGNAILEVTETWIYTCSGVAEATTFVNTATATFVDALGAEVTDSGTAQVTVEVAECEAVPAPRYVDLSNGTIYDCWTDLIWLEDASCSALPHTDGVWGYANWANANLAASALADGTCGLTDGSAPGDWRLPTGAEFCGGWTEFDSPVDCEAALGLIHDGFTPPLSNTAGDGPWEEGDPFLEIYHSGGSYWTSTEVSWDSESAWWIRIATISLGPTPKTEQYGQVWPVRSSP